MDKYTLLQDYFGHTAFRGGQEQMIDALVDGRDALGIMPTGAGKSLCYQIPALMQDGIALVVSPLIALMKDQVTALVASGVRGAYLNSSLTPRQMDMVIDRAGNGAYQIMYIAPERLLTDRFLAFAKSARLSLFAVDEAHCVSQWGQDFRPSYLRIAEFLSQLPRRPPVGAFTATATRQVRDDITRLLQLNRPEVVVTGFDRKNLHFRVERPRDKFAALLRILKEEGTRSGIVYCATRKTVDQVTASLTARGIAARGYHAGLGSEERQKNQEDFVYDRVRVMVATNAFGMGIDKSNVSFVVHYNMPKNIESYYQEAGRAGRDGMAANCILLYAKQDVMTARYLIEHSEDNADLTDAERDAVLQNDLERLKQMTFYSTTSDCLRRFILRYFGERAPGQCGNCGSCNPRVLPIEPDALPSRTRRTKQPRPSGDVDPVLFEDLRALRASFAAKASLPAYVIFSDATLADMCRLCPQTWEDLLSVPGVGTVKRDRYGREFLNILCEHGTKSTR